MTEHAAAPWYYTQYEDNPEKFIIWQEGTNNEICATPYTYNDQRSVEEANAAHIVKCVNNHAALVEVLKELLSIYDPYATPDCERGEQIVERAEATLKTLEEDL